MDVSREKREKIKEYYLQDKIVEKMVETAKHREFAPTYPQGYGKRPDSVNYEQDFKEFVDKGAIAFHGSVERWKNPLLIGKMDADRLRQGWDLVIDIDADEGLIYAKKAALRIVEEFKKHGIDEENISVKFSGNRGFHIGLRKECFPSKIGGKKVSDLYPKLPQAIVGYLRERMEEDLKKEFLGIDPSNKELIEEEGPYSLADVENDWGDRHLFRMPYSLNEKSWLVAKPIEIDEIEEFEKPDAEMDKVDGNKGFLDSYGNNQAADIAVEALDWISRQEIREEENKRESGRNSKDGDYEIPENALAKKYFPPPIKKLLEGLEDGRKRALFILITFLRHVGYDWDSIEKEINNWNERNKEELRENYVQTQLDWHRKQDEPLMPPNFGAKGWYKDIGVIDEEEDEKMLDNFDNPVPYAYVLREKARNSEDSEEPDDEKDENS